tara:strand:+ start:118 stop:288 length:171 start_codon:yes stop_codon:yes gene_type:complete
MAITKKEGYFIINCCAFALTDNTVVQYPDDAAVQEFASEGEMYAAHLAQHPEQYVD